MACKLIESAQARWRKVNAPELVALVRAGTLFHQGKLPERPRDITPALSADPANTIGTEVAQTGKKIRRSRAAQFPGRPEPI